MLFAGHGVVPTPEQRANLQARGVQVEEAAVVAVEGEDHVIVRVGDGRTFEIAGLFVATRMQVAGPFAAELGCALETLPTGSYYRTNTMTKETTVRGVFACGDAAFRWATCPSQSPTASAPASAHAGRSSSRVEVRRSTEAGEPSIRRAHDADSSAPR